jgi:hypothetical protein
MLELIEGMDEMKKQQLQRMVNSIFSDDKIRAIFAVEPEKVMADYALTAMEKQAVLSPKMRLALVSGKQNILADGELETWF